MEVDNLVNLDNELSSLTKEQLIDKIKNLQEEVEQLQRKRPLEESEQPKRLTKKQRQGKGEKVFVFDRHPSRHVALKIAYLGWNYQGLASQEDNDQTIEAHLFQALIRTKLIKCRTEANYHRCGRTDKGVSAFSQVVSLDLRCKQTDGIGVVNPGVGNANANSDTELDYCKMLNSLLPKEIRVLAWSPVRPDFSARFDCTRRTYRYYLPKVDLDLERMKEGSNHLIGEHDFRNFCKLDSSGEKTTIRRIFEIDISFCSSSGDESSENAFKMCVIKISGQAFVWHQIRCIVSVLILVGKGLEEPGVVRELLDIEKRPKKPQYAMAVDFPLILFDVEHKDIKWKYSEDNVYSVLGDLQALWVQHAVKAQMLRDVITTLEVDQVQAESNGSEMLSKQRPTDQLNSIIMGSKAKIYQPLLERPVCERGPVQR